jgi:hypothetical protein
LQTFFTHVNASQVMNTHAEDWPVSLTCGNMIRKSEVLPENPIVNGAGKALHESEMADGISCRA